MQELLTFSILLNIGLAAALVCGVAGVRMYIRKWVHDLWAKKHEQKTTHFTWMPNNKNKIVFLGDGHIARCLWHELFHSNEILNRGVEGDTINDVRQRLDEVIGRRPRQVFIMVGINDLHQNASVRDCLTNYRRLVNQLADDLPDTEIFVQSILPIYSSQTNIYGSQNLKILELNAELQKMCTSLSLQYIDLHRLMAEYTGEMNQHFSNDGIHLMGNAYMLWKSELEEHVRLLPKLRTHKVGIREMSYA